MREKGGGGATMEGYMSKNDMHNIIQKVKILVQMKTEMKIHNTLKQNTRVPFIFIIFLKHNLFRLTKKKGFSKLCLLFLVWTKEKDVEYITAT